MNSKSNYIQKNKKMSAAMVVHSLWISYQFVNYKKKHYKNRIKTSPYIDKWRKRAHFDHECSGSWKFVVNDMFGTSSDLQMDNILIPARQLAAYHNPHTHNSQRGSLCPLKPHEPFPQFPQRALFLSKRKKIIIICFVHQPNQLQQL